MPTPWPYDGDAVSGYNGNSINRALPCCKSEDEGVTPYLNLDIEASTYSTCCLLKLIPTDKSKEVSNIAYGGPVHSTTIEDVTTGVSDLNGP